jgi:hypothetical protein
LTLAIAGHRSDSASFQVNATDAVVADVGHVQPAAVIERDTVWLAELRRCGPSAVAREAGCARAGDCGDPSAAHVDAPHQVAASTKNMWPAQSKRISGLVGEAAVADRHRPRPCLPLPATVEAVFGSRRR